MKRVLTLLIPIVLLRLFFTVSVGLIDDEAYHWSWTRDLALSYYDHPAMVAWLEKISTWILGDTEFAIRLPSMMTYFGAVFLLWKLAKEMFSRTAAYFACAMMLFTPLWGLAGYVASPEPPFIFCWLLASWIFWQSCRTDKAAWSPKKTWVLLGIVMGIGLNSKFPMALLAPGFGLYLLSTPDRRKELLTPWPWIGFLIATVICAPIFIWNIESNWPGFKYQFHDRHTGSQFSFDRWTGWFVAQVLFMGPALYLLQGIAFFESWKQKKQNQWRLLFCLTIPSILIFYPQPFFAEYKPHWMGPAMLLLAIGAGAIWDNGWEYRFRQIVAPKSRRWVWGLLAFLVPINLLFYSSHLYPWQPKVFRFLSPEGKWQTTYDLSNEFTGWNEFGEFVLRRQREIHAQTGSRPFIAALRYETTAQTIWGTKQKVYQLSRVRSHYTVAQKLHHEINSLKGLQGLVVTTEKYPANPTDWSEFDQCRPEDFQTFRHGELARTFTLWHCQNFTGIKNDFSLAGDESK